MTDAERKKLGAHYDFCYKGIKVDAYRILKLYGVTDPAQQHAIKKLLRAGRSMKTLRQDIQEVILSLQRWLEMLDEDEMEVGEGLQVGGDGVQSSETRAIVPEIDEIYRA